MDDPQKMASLFRAYIEHDDMSCEVCNNVRECPCNAHHPYGDAVMFKNIETGDMVCPECERAGGYHYALGRPHMRTTEGYDIAPCEGYGKSESDEMEVFPDRILIDPRLGG